ncbi:MAG: UvrD-helicase domain-containing protein, partial [Alicyclobacillus sp.]
MGEYSVPEEWRADAGSARIGAKGGTGLRWTDEQWRAIDRPPASAVVYAAPGSGKTSVIVEHIAQQLLARRVP